MPFRAVPRCHATRPEPGNWPKFDITALMSGWSGLYAFCPHLRVQGQKRCESDSHDDVLIGGDPEVRDGTANLCFSYLGAAASSSEG